MLTLTREQVIDRLRAHLVKLTDEDRSLCQVAKELNIFCHGFARLDSGELRREFEWLEKKAHRPLTRPELEQRAGQWQLARQILHGVTVACDAQMRDHDHCRGWDTFTDLELARFHQELLGEMVEVVVPPAQ
jgi:hypothetical protein